MNKRLFVVLAVALALTSGCGVASKVNARNDMEASKMAYKRCLEQNPNDPSKCEALRRAYEADMQAYRETSKGIRPGHVISIDQ